MSDHEPDTCRPVEIDGELIRVRGAAEMSDEARAALAEVIGAAKRKYAAEHPADRLTVDTITSDQLDALQLKAARMEHAVAEYAKLRVELEDTKARAEAASRVGAGYMAAAEQAEAALVRVHHVAALIHAGAPWTANHQETAARIRAAIRPPADEPPAEQGAPVDWQAVVARRERELKTVGEARHRAEAAVERVRSVLAPYDWPHAQVSAARVREALDEPKEH
jgi:hypothetical protein